MLTIRPAQPEEIVSSLFSGASPIDVAAVRLSANGRLVSDGSRPVAASGLVRINDGRLFLFFDVVHGALCGVSHARAIIRAAREMLAVVAEPVYTPCNQAKHATAHKLVALCGFEPTDEFIEDARVWLKLPRSPA